MMENVVKVLTPRYPDDIADIRAALHAVPFMHRFALSDIEVELLWLAFSSALCASYLGVNPQTLTDFIEWVKQ
jgi:hypothetical protein